jgi:hypothetical protein
MDGGVFIGMGEGVEVGTLAVGSSVAVGQGVGVFGSPTVGTGVLVEVGER